MTLLGKPILIPVEQAKVGKKYIWNIDLVEIISTQRHYCTIRYEGGSWKVEKISELQDMEIKYEEIIKRTHEDLNRYTKAIDNLASRGDSMSFMTCDTVTKTLPLSDSDKEYILENGLVGKEVKFNEVWYSPKNQSFSKDIYDLDVDCYLVAQLIREEKVKEESLPSIYQGELNTLRIKMYQSLAKAYNINEDTVCMIFNLGADWYKSLLNQPPTKLKGE